jgi:hypothetical protein
MGVGVVVVPVLVVVGVVAVVVVCVGAEEAGVVVVPGDGAPVGSAASAPPGIGPLKPTAVRPPPASADRITRRTLKGTGVLNRAPLTPDILGPYSS